MTDADRTYNVLFLCTGNSARSILAEAIVNNAGNRRFRAFSAGSRPAGRVNPHALALLDRMGHDTRELRSKSWDEFVAAGAPAMDFVFTVCDSAASESCPVWPGHPASAHWGMPDPAAVQGSDAEIAAAFDAAYCVLCGRIGRFLKLPVATLDGRHLRRALADVARSPADCS